MSAIKEKNSEERKKESSVSSPFFTPSKFAKISSRIFKRLLAKQYQELENDLSAYRLSEKQIKEFFFAEGYPILQWAIVRAVDAKPLSLLCKLVDKEALQEVFLSHDLEILQNFLFAEAGRERGGVKNYEKVKTSQIEKIRLMLSIDHSAVENFVKAKISIQSRCVTKNMELNFSEALAFTAKLSKQEGLRSFFADSSV